MKLWIWQKKHNLRVIEDAAPSIGAEYKGKRTGRVSGDFGAFSFQGAKLNSYRRKEVCFVQMMKNYTKKAYRIAESG